MELSGPSSAPEGGEHVTDVVDELPSADRSSAFANAPMGVALTTTAGVLVDANPALCRLLGQGAEELHGHSVLDFVHPDDAAVAREAHATQTNDHAPMRLETRLVRSDGTACPVQVSSSWVDATPEGAPPHLVMIVEDITDRKVLEAQLVHRSLHEPLTGLPNRILFADRLRHALLRGQREHTPTCVLIIDLDGFKAINDRYGHPIGDAVLVAFADRLRSVLRASDTAARLGGDEFGIVCENTDLADAEILADRVRTTVSEPLVLGEIEVQLGMSVGIGTAPGGAEPDEVYERVIRAADDAMYADKAGRRD
jgi:diguanylate cyclase (GGDEF)-like protein/PAS domain S-box-containing protein